MRVVRDARWRDPASGKRDPEYAHGVVAPAVLPEAVEVLEEANVIGVRAAAEELYVHDLAVRHRDAEVPLRRRGVSRHADEQPRSVEALEPGLRKVAEEEHRRLPEPGDARW